MMTNNIFLNGICRPWNIHAGTFFALSLRVLADAKGADSLSGWREKFSQFVPQRQSMAIDPNGIAHISIHGTLFNKEAPYFVAGYGGTDYEEVLQDIAVASKEAKGIFRTVEFRQKSRKCRRGNIAFVNVYAFVGVYADILSAQNLV